MSKSKFSVFLAAVSLGILLFSGCKKAEAIKAIPAQKPETIHTTSTFPTLPEPSEVTVAEIEIIEIDPFLYLQLSSSDLSGKGKSFDISYVKIPYQNSYFSYQVSYEKDARFSAGILANGDVVHFTIPELDAEACDRLQKEFGIQLTRTEADVTLDCFTYYPDDHSAFELQTEYDLEVARLRAEALVRNEVYSGSPERTAQLAGRIYYRYFDQLNNYRIISRMAYFYHISDPQIPDGYYIVAYDSCRISSEPDKDQVPSYGIILKRSSASPWFFDDYYARHQGYCFDNSGKSILGKKTLQECFDWYFYDLSGKNILDSCNVVFTDGECVGLYPERF